MCDRLCITTEFDHYTLQFDTADRTPFLRRAQIITNILRLVGIFTAWKALKFWVKFEPLYLRQFLLKHFEILTESIPVYPLNKF